MNTFLNGLKAETNYTYTENGAIAHASSLDTLQDLFGMGAAYRTRSDEDCIVLFKKAYDEDRLHALKCLFYLRDVRGGQGERRFFRVVMKWLASYDPQVARVNIANVPFYGRWDDLYLFVGTPLEKDTFAFMKQQLILDIGSKTPSLLAKWMKSENTSSPASRLLGAKTRKYLGMTARQYRKTLSVLRKRINVLERLMSAGEWDKIEFDKIPSRAGMIYKNAFARHDLERAKVDKDIQTYEEFAKDTTKKVNARALYPYECVAEAMKVMGWDKYYWSNRQKAALDDTQRLMTNKYWNNLADYFQKATFNGMAVVDTSGSMCGSTASAPINVAISLGLYCAEKAHGPFANHFMTFSSNPTLVEVEGVDFCDKVYRMQQADWGNSTNIEAAFDLLLETAINNHCSQEDLPQNLIVISDMEFDHCVTTGAPISNRWRYDLTPPSETLFESMKRKWANYGYKMPSLIFWNCEARHDNMPMTSQNGITFVSGMSPSIFEQIMNGKTALDLVLETLDGERYSRVKI